MPNIEGGAVPRVALGLLGVVLCGRAFAQDALVRLDTHGATLPPSAPGAPLTLWAPIGAPAQSWSFSATGEGVKDVLFAEVDGAESPALTALLGLNLGGRYQLTDRIGLAATLPVWGFHRRIDAVGAPLTGRAPTLGDLHLWAPLSLVRPDPDGRGLGLSLIPQLGVPTGNAKAALGNPGLTPALLLAPGLGVGPVRLAANLGVGRRPYTPSTADEPSYGQLLYGVSAGFELGGLRIGGELRGTTGAIGPAGNASEALLTVRAPLGRAWIDGGGGGGLTAGLGAAGARALVGFGYAGGPEEVLLPDAADDDLLTLTVTDAGGAPVTGAEISQDGEVLAHTDAKGTATLPNSRSVLKRPLEITAPHFEPAEALFGEEPSLGVVLPWSPVPVEVRIQDQAGRPVTGAVKVQRLDGAGSPPLVTATPLVLPVGRWALSVEAEGAGAQVRVIEVRPGAATPVDIALLPAAGPAAAALHLVDPEGAPVIGARVLVDGQPVGASGAAGDVELAGLTAGSHRITVQSEAFTEREVDAVLDGARTEVPIRLERVPGSVRVSVHQPDGAPAVDATLRFDGPRRLAAAPVDPEGERLQVLGPGDWTLLVTSPTWGFQERTIRVPEDAWQLIDVDVVLQPGEDGTGDLLIRVIDPDGQPVDGASLTLDDKPFGRTSTGGELRLQQLDAGPRALAIEAPWHRPVALPELEVTDGYQEQTITLDWVSGATRVVAHTPTGPVTDATARFVGPEAEPPRPLGEDGDELLELSPGMWTVLVTSPKLGFHEAQLEIPADSRGLHRVDALLVPSEEGSGRLVVRVLDPEGQPVDGALVRLDGEEAGLTSNTGVATLTRLDPGRRRVTVESPPMHEPGSQDVTVVDEDGAAELRLGWAPGTVELVVVDEAGQPIPDAVARLDGPRRVSATPLGPDGMARLALGAGAWQVLATSPTRGFAEEVVTLTGSERLTEVLLHIAVVPEGRSELLVRVRDPDGQPVVGATVRVAGREDVTAAGGALLLEDLPTGEARLEVSAPGFAPTILDLDLEAGAWQRFAELTWTPRRLEVRANGPDGAPVDAELRLVGPADVAPVHTGADGVEALSLRPGTWQVVASTATLGPTKAEVTLDVQDAAVSLVLSPSRVEVTAEAVAILDQVNFDFDQATLRPESAKILEQVANTILSRAELLRVQVQGHSDDRGTVAYNQALSQQRAEAVVAALVKLGVPPEKLVAVGYGMQRPLVPNDSDAHRAQNRRVVFEIVEQAR